MHTSPEAQPIPEGHAPPAAMTGAQTWMSQKLLWHSSLASHAAPEGSEFGGWQTVLPFGFAIAAVLQMSPALHV